MTNSNLLYLLQLTDSTLPIGSFSHSSGLETYVQKGIIKDKISAKDFVVQMLEQNLQYTDAAFASLAYNAFEENNFEEIVLLDETCTAVKLPKEIRQASLKLGKRLLKIFSAASTHQFMVDFRNKVQQQNSGGNYSVLFGAIAASLNVSKLDMLIGFYYNAAVGMITNSVKLIPLGQQDGQEILFSLHTLINELATKSLQPDKDLLGLCCAGFDIRSMQHEGLYSRLYMS
jgi:urease accessory protein